MSFEANHECDTCGLSPIRDKCFCESCFEEAVGIAYTDGKEAGRKEAKDETV